MTFAKRVPVFLWDLAGQARQAFKAQRRRWFRVLGILVVVGLYLYLVFGIGGRPW